MEKELSVIIVGYNERINHFFKMNRVHFNNEKLYFIIVNNGFNNMIIPEFIINNPNVYYIKNRDNLGYGFGINTGMRKANTAFCLICNDDIKFEHDFFNKLLNRIDNYKKNKYSVVGFNVISKLTDKRFIHKTYYNPYIIMYHMSIFPYILSIFSKQNGYIGVYETIHFYKSSKLVYGVSGACFLIYKPDFNKLNGFDERFFLMYDETDYFIRVIKKGLKIFYEYKLKVYHIHNASSSKTNMKYFLKSMRIFVKKHYGNYILIFIELWVRSFLFLKELIKR